MGWVLYICYGTDFVMREHQGEYVGFLNGAVATSTAVKQYIAQNIFLKYVGEAAEIVLFLLSTMTIVEILNNNGCFDFLTPMVRTRHSQRLLWTLTAATFFISANLDNLTTTSLMLVVTHNLVSDRKARFVYGSAVVLAANAGGAMTVIGDPAGVVLWNMGAVTATNFSMSLLLPCLAAWALPTFLLSRMLPERVNIAWKPMPFRGDDTNLNTWQRALMLFVGIGGLWFIPTFHNITKLSPFLGALCVLAVLWVVNEAFNHKLIQSDQTTQRRIPMSLQYGTLQQLLFVTGIMLGMGAVTETGVWGDVAQWFDTYVHDVWLMGVGAGLLSSIIDTFTIAISNISLYQVGVGDVATNGAFWKIIAYSTAVGGCLLSVGSVSGLALMRSEHVKLGWYVKHLTPKVLLGWIIGYIVLWMEINIVEF